MASPEFTNLKINVDGLKQVVVSEIVEDSDYGGYARTLYFYDQDSSVAARRPVLEVMLRDTVKDNLELTTPPLTY